VIILGVDPGIATVGFGLISAQGMEQRMLRCGVITTPPGIRSPRGFCRLRTTSRC
jgi:crossover junction endodeoxyribonuclease RuvC